MKRSLTSDAWSPHFGGMERNPTRKFSPLIETFLHRWMMAAYQMNLWTPLSPPLEFVYLITAAPPRFDWAESGWLCEMITSGCPVRLHDLTPPHRWPVNPIENQQINIGFLSSDLFGATFRLTNSYFLGSKQCIPESNSNLSLHKYKVKEFAQV